MPPPAASPAARPVEQSTGGTSPFDLPIVLEAAASGPPTEPPARTAPGGPGAPKRGLLVAAGVVAVLVIGVAGFGMASGGDEKTAGPRAAPSATATVPSPQPPITPTAPTTPSRIDAAGTDPKPMALTEIFPDRTVTLGGVSYLRDRQSVNHDCALTARGAMATALRQGGCTSVVRVTFIDQDRTHAVTTGVAVMPTKAAALRAGRAGDPSRYEWFRGMDGKRSQQVDRAGGYAAATVRGRYIIYAYGQHPNGRPTTDTAALKAATSRFIDYAVRPVTARAR